MNRPRQRDKTRDENRNHQCRGNGDPLQCVEPDRPVAVIHPDEKEDAGDEPVGERERRLTVPARNGQWLFHGIPGGIILSGLSRAVYCLATY